MRYDGRIHHRNIDKEQRRDLLFIEIEIKIYRNIDKEQRRDLLFIEIEIKIYRKYKNKYGNEIQDFSFARDLIVNNLLDILIVLV